MEQALLTEEERNNLTKIIKSISADREWSSSAGTFKEFSTSCFKLQSSIAQSSDALKRIYTTFDDLRNISLTDITKEVEPKIVIIKNKIEELRTEAEELQKQNSNGENPNAQLISETYFQVVNTCDENIIQLRNKSKEAAKHFEELAQPFTSVSHGLNGIVEEETVTFKLICEQNYKTTTELYEEAQADMKTDLVIANYMKTYGKQVKDTSQEEKETKFIEFIKEFDPGTQSTLKKLRYKLGTFKPSIVNQFVEDISKLLPEVDVEESLLAQNVLEAQYLKITPTSKTLYSMARKIPFYVNYQLTPEIYAIRVPTTDSKENKNMLQNEKTNRYNLYLRECVQWQASIMYRKDFSVDEREYSFIRSILKALHNLSSSIDLRYTYESSLYDSVSEFSEKTEKYYRSVKEMVDKISTIATIFEHSIKASEEKITYLQNKASDQLEIEEFRNEATNQIKTVTTVLGIYTAFNQEIGEIREAFMQTYNNLGLDFKTAFNDFVTNYKSSLEETELFKRTQKVLSFPFIEFFEKVKNYKENNQQFLTLQNKVYEINGEKYRCINDTSIRLTGDGKELKILSPAKDIVLYDGHIWNMKTNFPENVIDNLELGKIYKVISKEQNI